MNHHALIVLSGGMDSTLCLFWALHKGMRVTHTISFYYGQKHSVELISARLISSIASKYTEFTYGYAIKHVQTDVLSKLPDLSLSALVGSIDQDVSGQHPIDSGLPASFVPGRNLLFLTMAAIFAYGHEIDNLVTGVCQTDYSGYPDCRANTIKALNVALNLGMDRNIEIHTPLMYLTKAESLRMIYTWGLNLRKCAHDALSYSYTCYNAAVPPCGKCPACILRIKGFTEASMTDPLLERLSHESGRSSQ